MKEIKIGVIGLGYVGLPLAIEYGKYFPTIGFDINTQRIKELTQGFDKTLEVTSEDIKKSIQIKFSNEVSNLKDCNFYIITVPTPIDKNNRPNLLPLLQASKMVGQILKKGDIVIYESTVYPGCTEEDCVPVLEHESSLKFNQDFFCGYSPERINPGDKVHTVTQIRKVTSGSTAQVAEQVDQLYKSIICAGTFKASSIKVAEAAKVIENSQRDINIAFVNELALIFNKLGIDTQEVLEAARTKWNFLSFSPGLVGGHCIGVDPYYLTHKAEEAGYMPEIILAGRRLNDNMGSYIANQVVKLMIKKDNKILNSHVLILGITFKENCTDIRNTKVINIINELMDFGCQIDVYDPWANKEEVKHEYAVTIFTKEKEIKNDHYDAIILAVSHQEFTTLNLLKYKKNQSVIYDVKGVLSPNIIDARL